MKTYLEYKDEKSQIFWEISISENNVISRYGEIGSDGEEVKESFESKVVAVYEMHKQLLTKREKGYVMPNQVSMKELNEYKVTNLKDIDKKYYEDRLEGTYRNIIFIEGDITLEQLDLDSLEADGIIVTGNLKINGGVENACGDTGSCLIVEGDVLADYVVAGGSEIHLLGQSYIHTFIVGFDNGGMLIISNANALCEIHCDHYNDVSGNIEIELSVFDNQDHIVRLKEFVSKEDMDNLFNYEEDYEEDEDWRYFDIDEFNKYILDDKMRLKLLKNMAAISQV